MIERAVHLLETTIRDGSYEIDFQFTAEDTAFLAGLLDRAGVRYLEICPGNGVGAAGWGDDWRPARAGATDEEYLAAARAAVQHASLGVLFVVGPEFTPVSYLDLLARYRLGF